MTTAGTGRKSATARTRTRHPARKPKRPTVALGSKHGKTEDPRNEFNDEEWRDMVATAAYFRAEARGFADGSAEDDWVEGEAELRERLSAADGYIESPAASGGHDTGAETTEE